MTTEGRPARWRSRVGWFVLLWAAGVASRAALAALLKLVMRAVGLSD